MKEIISRSKDLTVKGDPIIKQWMLDVEKAMQKHSFGTYDVMKKIWCFETLPSKSYLFDALVEVRRILKLEGVFSQDLVE